MIYRKGQRKGWVNHKRLYHLRHLGKDIPPIHFRELNSINRKIDRCLRGEK